MVQSLNTTVDLVETGQYLSGIPSYGKIMIGDKAFEYYNDRRTADYIHIPWSEVDCIAASVYGGKWISRFAVMTKKDGSFVFSSRDNKKVLRAVNRYVDSQKLVRSLSVWDVWKAELKRLFHKHKG